MMLLITWSIPRPLLAQKVAHELIDLAVWFEFAPTVGDRYDITVQAENEKLMEKVLHRLVPPELLVLPHKHARHEAVCTWESYREGEFQGICGNPRPCPKHDKEKI